MEPRTISFPPVYFTKVDIHSGEHWRTDTIVTANIWVDTPNRRAKIVERTVDVGSNGDKEREAYEFLQPPGGQPGHYSENSVWFSESKLSSGYETAIDARPATPPEGDFPFNMYPTCPGFFQTTLASSSSSYHFKERLEPGDEDDDQDSGSEIPKTVLHIGTFFKPSARFVQAEDDQVDGEITEVWTSGTQQTFVHPTRTAVSPSFFPPDGDTIPSITVWISKKTKLPVAVRRARAQIPMTYYNDTLFIYKFSNMKTGGLDINLELPFNWILRSKETQAIKLNCSYISLKFGTPLDVAVRPTQCPIRFGLNCWKKVRWMYLAQQSPNSSEISKIPKDIFNFLVVHSAYVCQSTIIISAIEQQEQLISNGPFIFTADNWEQECFLTLSCTDSKPFQIQPSIKISGDNCDEITFKLHISGNAAPTGGCFKCGLSGHFARDCPS